MKKVKLMLTAITVMAIVGGALAFKAIKLGTMLFCTTKASSGACTIHAYGFSITPAIPGEQPIGLSSCTTTNEISADCAARLTYANQ